MKFIYNDGGRKQAGYKGETGDCVVRSVAIASELPYKEVYENLAKGNASQRKSKYEMRFKAKDYKRPQTASNGISTKRKWFKDYMKSLGFEWIATMQIGSGCKVHLKAEELPKGRIIARLSKHYTTVIDGVLNDTYDCSREGTRCVYGYWKKGGE